MTELISVIIAWIVVFTIPNRFLSKSESKKEKKDIRICRKEVDVKC